MNIKLLIIFCVLNVLNVITQTIKSIVTIKCGKCAAALINAIAYGLYTIVVIYTVCDLPLILKAFIVAIANLIGVYIVKFIEEKKRKDKMWKVELALPIGCNPHDIKRMLTQCNIPCNYYDVGKWRVFNCYCEKQEQTSVVKNLCKEYNGKISAYESKIL